MQTQNEKYIEEYELHSFKINVLNKDQTLLEKLMSLIRFSFDNNVVESISNKIRHFYDLYYLTKDQEVKTFIQSPSFKNKFKQLLAHDQQIFSEPNGWQTKELKESALINDFENVWPQLKEKYTSELSALGFTSIPEEKEVAHSFELLIENIR